MKHNEQLEALTVEDTMDLNPYLSLTGRLVAWFSGPTGSGLFQPRFSGEGGR